MSLIHIEKNPPASVLRWFGLTGALFFAVVGVLIQYRTELSWLPLCLYGVSVLWFVTYYLVRSWQRYFYLGWMYATAPIAWCMLNLILIILYYAVLTPLGVVLRLFGHDPLRRHKASAGQSSYWVAHEGDKPLERYFKQY